MDLNGSWNKEALPHLGRHPNDYHKFVMEEMDKAADMAGNNVELYFASRGLHKPKEISDGTPEGKKELWEVAAKVEGHEIFRKKYENEHYDTFEVIQYNLKREGKG